MAEEVREAPIAVADVELEDLSSRLSGTRWPEREPVDDWGQGARLASVQGLCEYWRDEYDWRRCEAMLNAWNPHRTTIDGVDFNFFHVRSPEADALPVVMTHGWPGSVIEFHKVVAPLTDPRAHGADPADALHLVLPELPGFGFSSKPRDTAWKQFRMARAWVELMRRLGYGRRWAAQGGDWGGKVSAAIGTLAPPGCIGIHLNSVEYHPTREDAASADPEARRVVARAERYDKELSGYNKEQSTRPQTLGYALADSPAGQAAWIYEKFHDWTDNTGQPESVFTYDEMLDNIMLYWLNNAGASSARRYWEAVDDPAQNEQVHLPAALSMFPKDFEVPTRKGAERRFINLVRWGEPAAGGHFAAFEQPALFVEEVRAGLQAIRHFEGPSEGTTGR